jgi:hypothetical protein
MRERRVAMMKVLKTVATIAGAVLLAACAQDFVVGDWVALTGPCDDGAADQLSIVQELTGTGTLVVGCSGSASILCAANMYASESFTRNGMWQLQADFSFCEAANADLGRALKDCQENGTDQLRCCNPDGTGCLSYQRQ